MPVTITFPQPASDPSEVIRFHWQNEEENIQRPALDADSILVSFVVAPINPQDMLVLSGRYPVKPIHKHEGESIPGYDGVARVTAVGGPSKSSDSESSLQVGDLVIPRRHGLGTWRSQAVFKKADVIRLGPWVDPVAASLFRLAFVPAYLLVEDMRSLKPGDWIVQNAASGVIAQLVAQFARLKGCRVCSVVRDRPESDSDQLKQALSGDGDKNNNVVLVTESELEAKGAGAHPALAQASAAGRVVLALDAAFGASGERLASLLSRGGTYVNYGSLSGGDGVIRLSQRLLFWNEARFRNFRLSEQLGQRTPAEQDSMFAWFEDMLERGLLTAPAVEKIQVPRHETADFEKKVIELLRAASGNSSDKKNTVGMKKHVLDFEGWRQTA